MIIFLGSYPSEDFSREAQGDLGAEYDHGFAALSAMVSDTA